MRAEQVQTKLRNLRQFRSKRPRRNLPKPSSQEGLYLPSTTSLDLPGKLRRLSWSSEIEWDREVSDSCDLWEVNDQESRERRVSEFDVRVYSNVEKSSWVTLRRHRKGSSRRTRSNSSPISQLRSPFRQN